MSVRPLGPWTTPLRLWQDAAYGQVLARTSPDCLVVATPGAGKTTFALRVAHARLAASTISRLIVVCPTNHLRRQWAVAAGRVGLQLDPFVTGDQTEGPDYHGLVVTYQQLCGNAMAYRRACAARPTLVIFDEIHHAGDGKDWGDALRLAFEGATQRLSLSGTPFRSDAAPIPFVRYQAGVSVSDIVYGYSDALREGVCRPVWFPSYGGTVSWLTANGNPVTASFAEPLPEAQRRERLKAAILHPDWMLTVLLRAQEQLSECRRTHQEAGGLVIAQTQDHARELAGQLRHLTGDPVPVAVSDDPGASQTIQTFAAGRAPWLVAVNMVSEGVDIPRLRVGVFGTNILTEMYFRQVVGRLVRRQAHLRGAQPAYLYIPSDPVLLTFARRISEERDHVLHQSQPVAVPKAGTGGGTVDSQFRPMVAVARAEDVIAAPDLFTAAAPDPSPPVTSAPGPVQTPLFARKDTLRQQHKRLVGQLASRTRRSHREINVDLIRVSGSRIESATVEQLETRVRILESWLKQSPAPSRASAALPFPRRSVALS